MDPLTDPRNQVCNSLGSGRRRRACLHGASYRSLAPWRSSQRGPALSARADVRAACHL